MSFHMRLSLYRTQYRVTTTPLPAELGPVKMSYGKVYVGLFLNTGTWMRIFMAASLGRRPAAIWAAISSERRKSRRVRRARGVPNLQEPQENRFLFEPIMEQEQEKEDQGLCCSYWWQTYSKLNNSVADPDSGSGIRCLFDPLIRDG
jgi:hypothetical protein